MESHSGANEEEGGQGAALFSVFVVDEDPARGRRTGAELEAVISRVRVFYLVSLEEAVRLFPALQPECLLLAEEQINHSGRLLLELLAITARAPDPPLLVVTTEGAGGTRVRAVSSIATDWAVVDESSGALDHGELRAILLTLFEERDRRREETRRAYSERLATLRRIFSKAAHEINNPAAIIRLALAAVEEAVEARAPGSQIHDALTPGFSSEDAARLRDLIRSADDALGRIVTGLRDLESQAGVALGHQTALTMDDVVHRAQKRLMEKSRPSVDVSFELASPDEFFGDRDQLVRLVLDLVDNAIEAAAPDGKVAVRTSLEGQTSVLTVEDSGRGVDAGVLANIFEPLFSTRAARGALGMGLSRVWGIVERHGGTIRVEKGELGGARFVIQIPLDRNAEPLSVTSSQVIPASGTERGPRILIVDDEPQIRDSYGRVLRRHFEVDVAPSSAAALGLIQERSYALILCDVMMPIEDGVTFAQRLLRDFPDQASVLLFCTGGVLEAPQERFLTMWENGFLRKPLSAGELVSSVSAFIDAKSRLPLELEQPAS